MRTTIDKAGRIVIPAQLRERIGLVPGPVDVSVDGAALRIEPSSQATLEQHDGLLMIEPAASSGATDPITPEAIRELRLDDQR